MKHTLRLSFFLVASVGLIFGVWSSFTSKQAMNDQKYISELSATVFQQPREIQPFAFIDQNKKSFTEKKFKGQWTLLFFGFTHCRGICPTSMAQLSKVYKELPAKNREHTQVVFMTIDPKRDTPERLTDYLHSFNDNFIGVTGDPEELALLRKELGIIALENPLAKTDKRLDSFDHSGAVLLINPKGKFHGLFTMPHTPENMLTDLKKIEAHKIS